MGVRQVSRLSIGQRAPLWPDRGLDLAGLRASGWRPVPFRDVVLKVHQRCNLACDYCYVYTMADQSWRDRPMLIDRPTWLATARRMAEHATTHDLRVMRLILHGGEPLLAGADRLAEIIDDFRDVLTGTCDLHVQMQTNGVLLDEAMLAVLHARQVRIGVSLDGTASANDRHRKRADGHGSYDAVDRALRLLSREEYRAAFAGLLCTVDPATDPIECYQELLRYAPPVVDLLLPHGNWTQPPPRQPGDGPTPYADWLVAVFDRWYGDASSTRIRLFEDTMRLILGARSTSEQIGLSPVAVVVVETDGAIELADSLKSAYPGACATGLTVASDALDRALHHPGVVARQIGEAALSETCRACPERTVCGAGHYAHRYRSGAGFRNPTVYCADMLALITHARRRVERDLRAAGAGSNTPSRTARSESWCGNSAAARE